MKWDDGVVISVNPEGHDTYQKLLHALKGYLVEVHLERGDIPEEDATFDGEIIDTHPLTVKPTDEDGEHIPGAAPRVVEFIDLAGVYVY